jgi:stearoyl-CoA desaturase (delta-9 desaturase)
VSVLGHWFVGYRAHKHGHVRYALDGSAEMGRNLTLLGVLSFGEGFHNNHHASPRSARMGEAWYELDLGWYTLLAFDRLGWVHDLVQKRHSPPRPAMGPPKATD